MRTMFAADGTIPVGRAYILPTRRYLGADGGRVTIGGLRGAQLSNIRGLLVGEATTAARNSAIPVVSKEELARWATEQAEIIANSKMDEATKAECAEVVLECGGELRGLPIVCLGKDQWLTVDQLKSHLFDAEEVAISFDGEFSYDEDDDEVLPREFRREFEINESIFVVRKHDGSILTLERFAWPRSITGKSAQRGSHVASLVRDLIVSTWGDASQDSEKREIGQVNGTPIMRDIEVFQRVEAETEGDGVTGNADS